MADYHAIAEVAAAVFGHLEHLSAREQPPVPVSLCLPAALAACEGIAICLWQVTPSARNDAAPHGRNPSNQRFRTAAAFDLHFVAISNASDVHRQHVQLGWLLSALSNNPVLLSDGKPKSLDLAALPAGETISLILDQPNIADDLNLRNALRISGPTIGFVARSATIDTTPPLASLPIQVLR